MAIEAALMALPVDYREVVVLRHFADLSYGEMSAALGDPGEDRQVPALHRPAEARRSPRTAEAPGEPERATTS